ncbi:C69 family dipeptidase [Spiractinospora alimapuensis]|uniref:C69 family dipeptidase n=1 Tax=Spiractinospora alimapuensis TaxID=2820884 RepID=UPI0022AA3833|nr:C69 family dipeptidase [Spiractinospora alimapuensis]
MRTAGRTGVVSALALALSVGAAPAVADTETANDVPITPPDPRDKSIAFYVGKNLTDDGSVLLGGFGHEPSSHWMEIVPSQEHEEGTTIEVGATDEADIPGELTEIPQAERTNKYITSFYSEFAGFPAPLTNGGLNEHQVAGRDVWMDSREELVDMTPTPQEGPQYSDLSRIAMERASTAQEAAEIVGGLIDEHGYTTYGGNSHLFADENEGWVLVEFPGGEGLWAAERLGPDDVRVSYPGYIQEFPEDFADDPDFMGSENIVDFAVEQEWWDPDGDEPFNLQEAYGASFPTDTVEHDPEDPAPYRYPPGLEDELREMAPLSLEDMLRLVRDPRWADDRAGYGQVAHLRDDLEHEELATLWLAVTSAVTAPYIPFHIGADEVPMEYRQHRYLTSESPSSYLNPEFAPQEATRYATQTYKRLMYYTCARPELFLGEVTDVWEGFEAQIAEDLEDVEAEALAAFEDGDEEAARALLTDFSTEWAMDGLDLGDYLVDDLDTRLRDEEGGIPEPDVEVPEGTTSSASSQSMTLPEGAVSSRDRVNCDLGGGWEDGSALDRQGQTGDPDAVPDFRAASADGQALPWIPMTLTGLVGVAIGLIVRPFLKSNQAAKQ